MNHRNGRHGRDVYVSYFYNPNLYKERIFQIAQSVPSVWAKVLIIGAKPEFELPRQFKVIHLYRHAHLTRSPRIQFCLWSMVRRIARNRRVIVHDWFMSFILTFMLAREGTVRVYSPVISGIGWILKRLSGEVPSAGIRYDMRRLKDCLTEIPMLLFSHFTVVQSVALRTFYASRIPFLSADKVLVSYNPISPPRICDVQSNSLAARFDTQGKKIVTFLGNLERHKGIADMIWMRQHLDDRYLLVLAGSANGRENKRILATLCSMSGVVNLGKLNDTEVGFLHSITDCLILPSYHEGSPRVVSEFYLSGKPIVAYDNPGTDYCNDVPGFKAVPYGDIAGFVEAIRTVAGKHSTRSIPSMVSEYSLRFAFERIANHSPAGG